MRREAGANEQLLNTGVRIGMGTVHHAYRKEVIPPVTDDKPTIGTNLNHMMSQGAFFVMQAVFWCVVIAGWVRVARLHTTALQLREWLSRASLACGSLALLFTTAMTVYVRVGQQRPYDVWESRYLLLTATFSLSGTALALFAKTAPRLAGLSTSLFTLLIALADAVSL